MKSKELAKYLLQYPEAEVMFNTNKHFPPAYPGEEFVSMEDVNLADFTFDEKRNTVILPNLCKCYPEPD